MRASALGSALIWGFLLLVLFLQLLWPAELWISPVFILGTCLTPEDISVSLDFQLVICSGTLNILTERPRSFSSSDLDFPFTICSPLGDLRPWPTSESLLCSSAVYTLACPRRQDKRRQNNQSPWHRKGGLCGLQRLGKIFQGRWDLKGRLTLCSLFLLVEMLHVPTCNKMGCL